MKTYKYQMHTHTVPCSACAQMTPEELVNALNDGGYSGCVITNHFLNSNTGIDRNLPWNDFVKYFEQDYIECKNAAKQYDLDVIFGIEEKMFDGLEILCYGITPQFLYDNPQLANHELQMWYDAIKEYGGLVIQAHPFRYRPTYIPNPRVLPREYIDGIEVYNYCNKPEENLKAEEFAANNTGLILLSGADTHTTDIVCCAGIETQTRITDEKELVKVLKSGEYNLIR